jgi:hypothetical protein
MKIRQGFVSNSSSSSFVVMLPEGYNVPEAETDQVKEVFHILLTEGELWQEEMGQKDEDYWDSHQDSEEEPYNDAYYRLVEILGDYVVAELHGNDGEGRITLGKRKK